MTTRTRYFVLASLLVLGVGLGTGFVAYYMGFPAGAFQRQGGPEELSLVPRNATLVAYANVQDVMASSVRDRLRQALPSAPDGQQEFHDRTGINIERDIDRVVAAVAPPSESGGLHGFPGSGLVLARGRFDEVRIESLMREHGASVEAYKERRLINSPQVAVAFIESGLAAIGSPALVRQAIDLKTGGGDSIVNNDEMMELVRSLDSGNAWAVGRFDALTSQAKLPAEVMQQLPPITWFAASARVDHQLTGVLRAEARDEAAATTLRDVVRGFLALAKMQTGSRPEVQSVIDSLELGGVGTTVSLGFSVPAELFDLIGTVAPPARQPGD